MVWMETPGTDTATSWAPRIAIALAVIAVLGVTVVLAAPRLLAPGDTDVHNPASVERQFTAFGFVENIDYRRNGLCTIRVAIYDWVNLSKGFDIAEIPRRNQRYDLHGEGDACQAVNVAMATTNNHIAFRTGLMAGRWQLLERPTPALGCGGLEFDWVPDPA